MNPPHTDRPPAKNTTGRAPWRDRLYVIIFEADTRAGQVFDVVLLAAILLSIVVVSLETVESMATEWSSTLLAVEWCLTLLFTAEYIARLICVRRPLRYVFSFFGIIDLIACLPLYLTLFGGWDSKSLAIIRSVRLLRAFRVLKMMRMVREAHVLRQAVWKGRDKLFVFIAVVTVAVTISGTLMYQLEKGGAENEFTSIPESMYWAIVTMTTVGYGDIVPHTPAGKIVSSMLILLGYSLIIVPMSIISAEMHNPQNIRDLTPRTCSHCLREGHSPDAKFCDMCGEPLSLGEAV